MNSINGIKVSVIMPVYCGEKHLAESMDSVLGQSLKEIELICVDDGSTDASLSIINDYAQRDARVVVFTQKNQGSGIARNLALDHAKGEYVVFMDCDDFYPNENTLQILYDRIVENRVSICGGSMSRYIDRQISVEFEEKLKLYTFKKEGLIQYRDYQFDYGYHRFMYKRSFLAEHAISFPNLKRFQDVPFFVKAMICAKEFYAIQDVTYCYRKERGRSHPKDWTSDKYRDVLRGIAQNLKMSKEADLELLHARTWDHFLEPAYYEAYEKALLRHNYETLMLVESVLDEADPVLIGRAMPKAGNRAPVKIAQIREEIRNCKEEHEEHMKEILNYELTDSIAVSVILPSLNVEPYIRLCIESVMCQSLKNIEIICVDAGSKDGTVEVLEQYARIDTRIRIIQSELKSYGYQVNLGIKAAKGKYVAILETDDYISNDMYAALYEIAEREKLDVVKGDYFLFVGDGKRAIENYRKIVCNALSYARVLSKREVLDLERKKLTNSMYIWAGLYNTQFLKTNQIYCQETPGASFQDNGFWFEVLMHVKRIRFVHRPFYHLRRDNPNSSVMAKNKMYCMKAEYDFIRLKIDEITDREEKELFIKLCALYRFKNYIFTYNRIAEVNRLEYLKMIQSEFVELEKKGELGYEFFADDDRKQLVRIMDDPELYYEESSEWKQNNAKKYSHSMNENPYQSRIRNNGNTYSKMGNILIKILEKLILTIISVEETGMKNTARKIVYYIEKRSKLIKYT